MDKKVRETILDIMADTPNISKEEVVELIKTYDDTVDVEKLIDREYKAKATRLMSTFRDEHGVRDVFTIKNNEDLAEYVNVTRTKELEDLAKVKNRLESNIRGNSISLLKVETRIMLVEGQETVFSLAIND